MHNYLQHAILKEGKVVCAWFFSGQGKKNESNQLLVNCPVFPLLPLGHSGFKINCTAQAPTLSGTS